MNVSLFLDQLGENTLRGTVLILAICALRPWIRRFVGASAFQWIWLLVAVRLLLPSELPPLIQISPPESTPPAVTLEEAPSKRGEMLASPLLESKNQAAASEEISRTFSWSFIVWAFGFFAVAAFSWSAGFRFWSALRRHSKPAGQQIEQSLAELCVQLEMPLPRVLETSLVSSPAVAGLFRPVILLPRGLSEKLGSRELATVLLHELGHLKRGDLWRQALLRTAVAVHWFNPCVWLASALARIDRELACDELVLAEASPDQAAEYDRTLLHLVQFSQPGTSFPAAAGILETLQQLKHRIQMIHQYRPKTNLSSAAALLFLTCAGLATFAISLRANPDQAEASGPTTPAATNQFVVELKYLDVSAADAEAFLRKRTNSVLKNPDVTALLEALQKSGKVDLLSSPQITTLAGQEATSRIGSEVRYPTEWADDGSPAKFETEEVGATTTVLVQSVSDSGVAKVSIRNSMSELAGWEMLTGDQAGTVLDVKVPPSKTASKPVIGIRKSSAELSLPLGSWTLIGSGETSSENKSLWILVTVREVQPSGPSTVPGNKSTSYSENRPTSDVRSLKIDGPFTVEWAPGQPMLQIEAPYEVYPHIQTVIEDDRTLRVFLDSPINTKLPIKVRVMSSSLEIIRLNGALVFSANNLRGTKLLITTNGATQIKLAGACDSFTAELAGACNLGASNLATQRSKVTISGAGKAEVNADETLDVEIFGAGSVFYRGNPKVQQNIQGAGAVNKM